MDSAPDRRTRNPQGTGHRLRDELVHAADRILARTGDEAGLSLRAVAREAGIAAPSIYLHFPDKHALVRAVMDARATEMSDAVAAALAGGDDPVQQLRAACGAYCAWALSHPQAYRVLFANRTTLLTDSTIAQMPGGAIFGTMIATIAEGMAQGNAAHGDAERIAINVWTALHGIVMLRSGVPSFPWPALATQIEDVLVGLVGVARRAGSDQEGGEP